MALLSTIKRAANVVPRWPFTINRQSEQARGLLAWYPGAQAQNGGAALDLSGGGFNGTVAAISSPPGPSFGVDQSGNEAFVYSTALLPVNLDLAGPLTLCCWVYLESSASFHTFIAKRNGAAANYALRAGGVGIGDGKLSFYWNTGGFSVWQSTATVCSDRVNKLAHYAVSYTAGIDPVLYVDGIAVAGSFGAGTSTALTTNADPASIGYLPSDGEPMTGRIRDVRFYNRALSALEVGALYDPATRYELYQPIHSRLYFLPALNNTRVSDFNIALGAV